MRQLTAIHLTLYPPSPRVSFTTSCNSAITKYPFENGRRYHAFKSGSYPLPNDELELDRLNVVHHMLKKALDDRLFLAPVAADTIHRVLDLGTGTGIWTVEMADKYPQAEFLGNDLSPLQPAWVPPNVRFEVDDIESGWAYSGPFDYIFCRALACAVGDWPKLVRQAYANVRPGGWAEFQDFDMSFYSEDDSYSNESDTAKFMRLLREATRGAGAGKEASPGPRLEQWVRDAGFENIVHQKIKLPLGPWPKDTRQKEVGLFNLSQTLDGLEAFSMRLFTSVLKWEPLEVEVLCAKVRKELKTKDAHRIQDFHVVYGRRPTRASSSTSSSP
ncbi:S-adenosyl-L-methionine-dependent methyltransferase [Aaosphaeria arxii CBS 175.79]|uniref:S-adenosyl-L-methionine-dependent methyltransferase n=1 Tax=Aaosphaeria arxii CBS 175.79 TaxID=1450172 RepID=A0A6A5XLS9_9PLEO|nr:S-adenosyl-L-methionine-dependent methyltransferase [Aaosphaeria arxii CBS 175.79]KAF2013866.1 S-adenosyl-L-methionine-dependent methyltransferase [Aaosphaeria arxii CBS 175.79]